MIILKNSTCTSPSTNLKGKTWGLKVNSVWLPELSDYESLPEILINVKHDTTLDEEMEEVTTFRAINEKEDTNRDIKKI